MSIMGIVGSEARKFTSQTEARAKDVIHAILSQPGVVGVTSGHCHLGGIDIWAEELGAELGLELFIFPPLNLRWSPDGYKERNLQIVNACTEMHNITVDRLPENYTGMRFSQCYHCSTTDHVKSGGCWTLKQARRAGKPGTLHVLNTSL